MAELHKTYGKRNILIVFSLLILLMIVGSFADYPFSQAVYNQENVFGIALAAFGELPAALGLVASGLLLMLGRNKARKGIAVFQLIAGGLLLLLGCVMAIYMPGNYLEAKYISYIVGTLLVAGVIFMMLRLSKQADREMMIKVALVIVLVAVLNMVVINVIKIPWGRPRMRLISEDVGAVFTSWWVAGGSAVKERLLADGIAADEFKSFPSGHTANAAVAMLLPLLTLLSNKWKGKETLLFIIGAAWGLLVALSRVIMGAHFITDTTMGFAVTYIIILIVMHFVFFKREEKTWLQKKSASRQ